MTPREIVGELDRYIIGQGDAKRAVAIALRNRWRRQQVDGDLRAEISPSNIILVGPTGVGKTEIARRLARLAAAPFIKVEASKFTEVGYVGRDVESMIRDLMEVAIDLVKEEARTELREKAEERAAERLLDLLFPPPVRPAGTPVTDDDRDEGARRESSRDKLRVRLRSGDLDDREVEMEVSGRRGSTIDIFGPQGVEQMGINLQDMMGGREQKSRRKMRVDEARRLLIEEEMEALMDHEKILAEARDRAESSGIVFIDEIDKVVAASGKQGPDVSREGVQRDLLPIVEGSAVQTKHGTVKTDHILFVAAGAFHGTSPTDLIPELQGRFPIRVELTSLGAEDFVRILQEPEGALLKQYGALFASDGVEIRFTPDAVREIADVACRANESTENIGARRLQTVMAALLEPWLYDVPDEFSDAVLDVDGTIVRERLGSILKDEDMRQYIL
ncbi:MAG: ATP-dependent protease ATPase subunit HslU [Gemmatimonadetes bacterium]|nr:ATP-dependent protease ATPase subunit HslU [Gemmatimonadota bacterium]